MAKKRKSDNSHKPLVLIVEDEQFLCELMVKKIKESGCEVEGIFDGEAALKFLENKIPDLILLDILLPGIDGFEVLRRIKRDERFQRIPVVMISNLGEAKDINMALKEGASEYLIKAEVSPNEIVTTVLKYVGR